MKNPTENIIKWGDEKGILESATLQAQLLKTLEETGETILGFLNNDEKEIIDGIGDIIVTLILLSQLAGAKRTVSTIDHILTAQNDKGIIVNTLDEAKLLLLIVVYLGKVSESLSKVKNGNLEDFSTNVLDVVLFINMFCQKRNYNIFDCLQVAYGEIKGRTGKMENGMFVKDK